MIAVKIEPVHKKVTQIEVHTLEDMQAVVDGYIETGGAFETGDTIMINDDGLTRFDDFFALTDGSCMHPLAGVGLVVGPADREGNNTDCLLSAEEIARRVLFMTRAQVIGWLNENRAHERTHGFQRLN